MTKRRRHLLLLLGIGTPLVLVAAVAVFLVTFDGSSYRGTVEQLVTAATGRDCSIAGDFEIALSLHPRVRAERITLANAAWSDTPEMISIDGFSLELEAWSVVSGPLHIHEVAIDGVAVLLEVDAEAGPNWIFEPPPSEDVEDDADQDGPLADGLVLDALAVRDVTITYREPESRRTLSVARLGASTDPEGHLKVELEGALDDTPLRVGGRLGPFLHLWEGGAVATEAQGSLGDATLTLGGSIADLATLADPDLAIELQGPELERLAQDLGLPVLGSGPFRLAARTTPATDGVDVVLDADLDRFDANARGNVDRLAPPSRVEATVAAAGPDLARLGAWLGVERLPAEAFALNGRLTHDADGTLFDDVRVEVGAAHLVADGRLGPPPTLEGTALRFELAGPDLAAYSAIAGVELPRDAFEVSGRLTWSGDSAAIERVVATIGDDRVEAHGTLSAEPGLAGTNLVLQGGGPTAAHIGERVGIALPDEAFSLAGRVRRVDGATILEGVRVRMGDLTAQADGTLGDPPQLSGTDLAIRAEGPDLSSVGRIADVPLPAGAFVVDGRVTREGQGYGLQGLVARLGDNTARFDGTIGDAVAGTVQAAGPDLAALVGPLLADDGEADLPPLPAAPFDVAGRVRMDDAGFRIEDLQATLDDVAIELTGRIGREPEFAGLEATFDVTADSLALLGDYVELPPLPEGALTVAGRVTSTGGVYALHDVRGSLAENRFTVDATLGTLEDLPNGIDATFDVAGPDLAAFAALSPDFALPALEYRAAGRVEVGEAGYRLSGVTAGLGAARARLDGLLGPPPELSGSDVVVELEGVRLAWFEELAGRKLPEQPVGLAGRIARADRGMRFERLEASLGAHRFEAHGQLGEPPHFEGTDLTVQATGPDLTPWAYFTDLELPPMPDESYDVSARFDGTPEAFALRDLAVHFGASDISGALTLDLGGTPTLTGKLVSQNLDLRPFFPEPAADPVGETTADPPPAEQPPAGEARLFSDDPIDLSVLTRANADVRLSGGTLSWPDGGWQSIDVAVKLQDGSLAIDPITIRDHGPGMLSGALSVAPAETGYRVTTEIRAEHLRLGLLGHNPVDPMLEPESRTEIVLETRGATPHELASNLDGYFWLLQGSGQVDNEALGLISMDVLFEIFSVLNPFAKDEEYTTVECGAYVVDIAEGITTIEAIALRTNKMTLGGRGRIDLESEKLDLTWTSKPRKGIGLSAGAITNSSLKLGGSLAHPKLELKPLQATATAGAAVATAGLSILATGLWDRATSGKKVCKKARKQIDKHIAERADASRPPSGS